MSITKRTDWEKLSGMLEPIQFDYSRTFTDEEFKYLCHGFKPREMEDKWFMFFENDWLYLYRSWTGFEIFRVKITKEQGESHYSIKEVWVENSPERFKNDNKESTTWILESCFKFLIADHDSDDDLGTIS